MYLYTTADALQLKVKIFRRSPAGNIQCEINQAENPLMEVMLEFVTAGLGISPTYTGANHYNAVTVVNPNGNLIPSTISDEVVNQDPDIVIEQSDEGSRADNSE